eukprot:460463-Alexandrium_andersonii.AAC.1
MGGWAMGRRGKEQVLLLQEHRLREDKVVEAKSEARRGGWRSHWAPAAKAARKGPAKGGVAVHVDSRIATEDFAPSSWGKPGVAGRLVGAHVGGGLRRPFVAISAYWPVKEEGVACRRRMCQALEEELACLGHS